MLIIKSKRSPSGKESFFQHCHSLKWTFFLVLIFGVLTQQTSAQEKQDVLDATESDPVQMGWMEGFPPPADRTVYAADGSFFKFPALRWSVVHMRELSPTADVSRGLGAPSELPRSLDMAIDDVTFTPLGSEETMTWRASLDKNYTDGILIMHHGKVVYEKYFGELREDRVHACMSVTKSFVGTLGAALVAEGILDPEAPTTRYVPELSESAFGDATVRQVMDMTTGLKFSEDYSDPKAEVYTYSAAGNPLPKPEGYTGPRNFFEYLVTVEKQGKHGEAFGYKTVNTEVLGWIISRATGKSVAELLSEKIWRPMGAGQSAYFQVDGIGTPFCGGGFSCGLRDLARFGEMMRNDGFFNGRQILPKAVVDDIRRGGSQEAFAKSAYSKLKGWSYRNMWWVTHNEHGAFTARGVHGQTIYVDPTAGMVIARFASHPVAFNSAIDPYSLPAYHAVAKYLMGMDR